MASIQKITDRKWRVQIYRRGKRKSATFTLEADAIRWANKIEGKFDMTDKLVLSVVPKRVLDAICSIPHTATDVMDAAIYVGDMVGIYFLINKDEIVYVGQSSIDMLARVSKHRREGKVFDYFSYIRCDLCDLDALEEKYISAFMPRLNFSLGRKAKIEA